jgi:hypothetical protein
MCSRYALRFDMDMLAQRNLPSCHQSPWSSNVGRGVAHACGRASSWTRRCLYGRYVYDSSGTESELYDLLSSVVSRKQGDPIHFSVSYNLISKLGHTPHLRMQSEALYTCGSSSILEEDKHDITHCSKKPHVGVHVPHRHDLIPCDQSCTPEL